MVSYRSFLTGVFAAATFAAMSSTAHASLFTGTFSLIDNTPSNQLAISSIPTAFSWNLTKDVPLQVDDLASFKVTPTGYRNGLTFLNDTFTGTFTFTAPDSAVSSVDGKVTESVLKVGAFVTSAGDLKWDTHNLAVMFAGGDELNIRLGDVSFVNFGGAVDSQTLSASVRQTAVTEPGSLALLGAGMLAIVVMRKRRPAYQ